MPAFALEFFQKALAIETDVYVELHPKVAYSNGAIGRVFNKLGQTDEAETHYLASYEFYWRCWEKNTLKPKMPVSCWWVFTTEVAEG